MKKLLFAASLTAAIILSIPSTHSNAALKTAVSISDSTPPTTMSDSSMKWKKKKMKMTKMKDSTGAMSGSMMSKDSTKK